jgi:hypothetical protein
MIAAPAYVMSITERAIVPQLRISTSKPLRVACIARFGQNNTGLTLFALEIAEPGGCLGTFVAQ